MKKKHKILLLCMMVLSVLFSAAYSFPVYAGTEKELCLTCETGSVKVGDMFWRIYRVAERQNGSFVLTGSFQNDPVNISRITEENIGSIAETLRSFTVANAVKPDASGKTDAEGVVRFSGLETGLYLAVPQSTQKDETLYTASPLLAELTESGEAVFPKLYRAVSLSGENVRLSVRKVWADHDDVNAARPSEVTVVLYKDGEPYDTVTLNASNDWQYKWTELDAESEWIIAERDVPQNYTVLIDQKSAQYVIQNSYAGSTVTTVTEMQTTASQTTGTSAVTVPVTTGEKLPQTGQLWWPVPILAIGGIVCILFGMVLRKKTNE